MYPVSIGFDAALGRIQSLIDNEHFAEALVTSVFTYEKTIRRSLKFCIISRGFTSKQSDILIGNSGFEQLSKLWPIFDPEGRLLSQLVTSESWGYFNKAKTMRNRLAHGQEAYKLEFCRDVANKLIHDLKALRMTLRDHLGFDGWTRVPVRIKPSLDWIPMQKKTPQKRGPK